MLPTAEPNDHVTPVLVEPETVAVNCCVWPAVRLVAVGLTPIETACDGSKVMVALADLVGSAVEVAVTVRVSSARSESGIEYRPEALSFPTCRLIDHVTPVCVVPVTVAVNCCVCPTSRLTVLGLRPTEIPCVASKVTVALADLVGSAMDVAVTVIVC